MPALLRRGAAAAFVVAWTRAAFAHEPHEPVATAWSRWPWEPFWLLGLAASAVLYGIGMRRLWRQPGGRLAAPPWRAVAYAAGWLTIVIALASPLDTLSDLLFAAHMTQHELLMVVAAPLLVLARPLAPLLWALPRAARAPATAALRAPAARRAWRGLTGPIAVFLLHGLALWIWHVPALFEAALRSDLVHGFQHFCFFWTAVLFWWSVVHGRFGRMGYGVSMVFVFATSLHSGVLGALLTWSPRVWYATYDRRAPTAGLAALDDQQLAGLIMWVPAGAVFLIVGLGLFAAWLGESERRTLMARGLEPVRASPAHPGGLE